MISVMDGYPDDVLALTATGHVTAEDYHHTLIPAAEERLKRHDRLRLLYVIGKDFDGFSPGAMMADAGFGLGHLRDFGHSAVVTDVGWIRDGMRLFAPFFRGQFRVFRNSEFEDAKDWVLSGEERP